MAATHTPVRVWHQTASVDRAFDYAENDLARAGDFVVFDFSHIGLVVEDQKSIVEKLSTIEGNTNGKGDRDSTSGDGVWAKQRERTLAKSYIRLFR
jgi:hypothetical protein